MKLSKKLICAVLAIAMLICMVPATTLAEGKIISRAVNTLSFATISDIHYCPQALTPEEGTPEQAKWITACRMDAKQYEESEAILEVALETLKIRAEREGIKYLLLPGDLTKNSEKIAHEELAKRMAQFEKDSGVQVIAINGNHDINTTGAASFVTGEAEPTEAITAQGFYDVYADLGYDLVDTNDEDAFYAIKDGKVEKKSNALSYVVDLDDYTRLIVVDSGMYSFDESVPEQTTGEISDECLAWINKKADEATAKGMSNLLLIHHNMAPHMICEPSLTYAFVLNDYLRVAEDFADHNIHYTFSGHLHQADIARIISDNGNVLYDCETGSLTSYPNTYREMVYTAYENGECEMEYNNVDFDQEAQFSFGGKTYAQGEFKKDSFGLCFGGALNEDSNGVASAKGFAKGLLLSYGGSLFKTMIDEGGILEWLKTSMDVDLEKIISSFLEPYIGKGIVIGDNSYLSAQNIMWFIEDLCSQVEELYIKNPEKLFEAIEPALDKLINHKMSDYTVSDVIRENTGAGEGHTYATLEDVIFTAVYYFYTGNEPKLSEDRMLQDVCDRLQDGIQKIGLFDMIIEIVFDDIVDGAILSKLEVRVDKFFNDDAISQQTARLLNKFVNDFLRGNRSYLNLVNTVFELGVLPYTSLFDILDQLLIQKYWSDSQDESLGKTIASFLVDFATDEDPQFKGDYNVSYTTEKLPVEVTTENYRKPTIVTVTMGDDSKTQANISWFSKESLPETDIEIHKAGTDTFTGKYTTTSEMKERYFPGLDFGIIGAFKYYFNMYQHTVKLTDLEPGTTYEYRVGNKARGWWSDWGTITTSSADSKEVTFFHTSDPQSQSAEQYTRGWANALDKAFKMYPEASFIACTGDLVDHGMNNKMWQWVMDTASDNLLNTFLMPATGNHDEMDDYSTVNNFILPNQPEQDTLSGVYYSYTYNNVHVAVLNTNDLNDKDALTDKQIEWLKNDLNSSDAQWKIVALHKALYSNGSHYDDDDVCAMREQLGSLLPQLDVDLVLQGHDHVYLRTYSLDSNKRVNEKYTYLTYGEGKDNYYKTYENPKGVLYEICGCSGVKGYKTKDVTATDKLFPRAESIVDAYSSMFSAIQIKDGILYFNAYIVDGDDVNCVDKFAIRKDSSQGTVYTGEWPAEQEEIKNNKVLDFFNKLVEILSKIVTVLKNIIRMYIIETNVK